MHDEIDDRLSALLADDPWFGSASADSSSTVSAAVLRRIARRRRANGAALAAIGLLLLSGGFGIRWFLPGEGDAPTVAVTSSVEVSIVRELAAEHYLTPPVSHHEFISTELAAIIEAVDSPGGAR